MDKHKTQSEKSNHTSLANTEVETQSSNSLRKRIQDKCLATQNTQARWIINRDDKSSDEEQEDYFFLSVSKCYENLFTSKVAQKQAKISQKEGGLKKQNADDYMICFCGRKYKLQHTFMQHIRENHQYKVQSVEYLHNKLQFDSKYAGTAKFQNQQHTLLNRIRNSSFKHLFIPEELKNIFSEKQKQIIFLTANQFITDNYKSIQKLAQLKSQVPNKLKNFCFTQIAIKHVKVFNRRVSILLKNNSFKDVFYLYVYNFLEVISEAKKYKRINTLVPISILIENKCEEFLNWIDHNYIRVFEKKNIFYQHIQLALGQKYTEVSRINKNELFTKQFLFLTKSKQSDSQLKNPEFLLQNFANWIQDNFQ